MGKWRPKKSVSTEEESDAYGESGRRSTFLSDASSDDFDEDYDDDDDDVDDDDDDEDEDDDDDDGGDDEEGEFGGEEEEYEEGEWSMENDPGYIEYKKSGKTTEDVLKEIQEAMKDEVDEPTEKEASHPGQLDLRVGEIIVAARHPRADNAEQTVEYISMGDYCEDLILSSPLASHYKDHIKSLQGKKVVVVCNAEPLDDHWVRSKTAMMLLTYEETKKTKPQKPFSVRDIVEEIKAENPSLVEEIKNEEAYKTEKKKRNKSKDEISLFEDLDEGLSSPEEKVEAVETPLQPEEIQQEPSKEEEVQEPRTDEKEEVIAEQAPTEEVKEKSLSPEIDEMETIYEPIEAPSGSVPGCRVYVDGHPYDPFPYSDQQVYEYVLRGFRVDEEGSIIYRDGKPLLVEAPENGEPKRAFASSVRNSTVLLE